MFHRCMMNPLLHEIRQESVLAAKEESMKQNQTEETAANLEEASAADNGDASQPGDEVKESVSDGAAAENEKTQNDTDPPPSEAPNVESLTAALEAEKDRVLRLSAEFDNYKKRSAKEMADFRKFANESLIKQLLTVVDNLERAIVSGRDTEKEGQSSIVEGVEMTHKDILRMLESFSVKPIDAEGKPFDPAFHQAVTHQESDEHPDNTVMTEFQKGYLLHDRLIRPSMVVVSKATAQKA